MTKTFELDSHEMKILLQGARILWMETQLEIEKASIEPQKAWRLESLQESAKLQLGTIKHLLTTWNTKAKGICPICHGAGYTRIAADSRKWYPDRHFHKCQNCGGQYQAGVIEMDLGMVNLHRISGLPCAHDYTYRKLGNCYHGYTCKHCGDSHNVDSGD